MNYEQKRQQLLEKQAAELARLEREEGVHAALAAACLPAPKNVCIHNDHVSLSYGASGYPDSIPLAKGLKLAEQFEPMMVMMEPARSRGCLSLYPAEARSRRDEWQSEGIQYRLCLRQHAFGEQSGSRQPQYSEMQLEWWAKVGEFLCHVTVRVVDWKIPRSRVDQHGNKRLAEISGSKRYSFATGSRVGYDARYMFQRIDDLADQAQPVVEVG